MTSNYYISSKETKEYSLTVPEVYAILITNGSQETMRIEYDGSVYWRKDGKMVKAEVDAELAQAFAYVVTEMTMMAPQALIEQIRAAGK